MPAAPTLHQHLAGTRFGLRAPPGTREPSSTPPSGTPSRTPPSSTGPFLTRARLSQRSRRPGDPRPGPGRRGVRRRTAPARAGRGAEPAVERLIGAPSSTGHDAGRGRGGRAMDQQFLERFRERSAYEAARTEPPDGFPKLPDLPLGRYTDPEFQELEHEYLFKRVWLYAAHDVRAARRPAATSCATSPARRSCSSGARTASVRAFYNACRHRGAPVVRGDVRDGPACSCASSTRGATTSRGELVRVPDERDFVGLQTGGARPAAGALRALGRLALRQPRPRRRCRCSTGSTRSRGCCPRWRPRRSG